MQHAECFSNVSYRILHSKFLLRSRTELISESRHCNENKRFVTNDNERKVSQQRWSVYSWNSLFPFRRQADINYKESFDHKLQIMLI